MSSGSLLSRPDGSRPCALVTGSSRGIGRAIALRLAELGADVVIHFRRQGDAAEHVAEQARALGARPLVLGADLESPDELHQLVDRAGAEFGQLDVLVANAASTAFKPVLQASPSNIDRTFATVVRSFALLVQRAAPLLPSGGRVVGISGMDTDFVQHGHGLLGAAKAAMDVLVKHLAVELGDRGVTVNSVKPGFIPSDSSRMYLGESYQAMADEFISYTPLGRHMTVDDVAEIVAFLAGPAASSITGENLALDGGLKLLGGPWASLNARLANGQGTGHGAAATQSGVAR